MGTFSQYIQFTSYVIYRQITDSTISDPAFESRNCRYGNGRAHLLRWIMWRERTEWCCNGTPQQSVCTHGSSPSGDAWLWCFVPGGLLLSRISMSATSGSKPLGVADHNFRADATLRDTSLGSLHSHCWSATISLVCKLCQNYMWGTSPSLNACQCCNRTNSSHSKTGQAQRWQDK